MEPDSGIGTPLEALDFRLMVDGLPTMVFTVKAAGELEFVNGSVLEYFGKTAEELKHCDKIDVHPNDLPNVVAGLHRMVESGEPHTVQQRLRRADGVYRWFQSRARASRDVDGRVVRWFAVLTDIDDLKRAEDAARADLRQIVTPSPVSL